MDIIKITIAAGLAYVAAYVAYKILLEVWCIAYGFANQMVGILLSVQDHGDMFSRSMV